MNCTNSKLSVVVSVAGEPGQHGSIRTLGMVTTMASFRRELRMSVLLFLESTQTFQDNA